LASKSVSGRSRCQAYKDVFTASLGGQAFLWGCVSLIRKRLERERVELLRFAKLRCGRESAMMVFLRSYFAK
jgi:hypothetical protein